MLSGPRLSLSLSLSIVAATSTLVREYSEGQMICLGRIPIEAIGVPSGRRPAKSRQPPDSRQLH